MNCVATRSIIQLQNHARMFYTSVTLNTIAKAMKKVMNRNNIKNKRYKYYETPEACTPFTNTKSVIERNQSINSKRANILNKLFMRHITDLMAAGECSSYFVGHGIEVSKVQVSPDFTCVNIYWIAKGTKQDDVIDKILKTHVGALRHELAQLKVVGVIPRLQFVKDKQLAKTAEIDRLLAIADFGDDYIPVDIATRLTTQLELHTALDPQTIKKIQSLETTDNEENAFEEPIPLMPQNIFNLNHSEILGRIEKSNKKLHISQSIPPQNEINNATSMNQNAISFANETEERAAFMNFLKKRQILKDKSAKLEKNYQPELEYLHEEWLKRQKHVDDVSDIYEGGDYIDEDFEQK